MSIYFSKEKFDSCLEESGEVGTVELISYPIAHVSGLPSVCLGEMVLFETGEMGLTFSVGRKYVEVLTFSSLSVKIDTKVARTGKLLEIPVGDMLLGKLVDPLGRSLYESKPIDLSEEYRPIESYPPGISARQKISTPLETGVTVVDTMVPLGKGQRELVIGDRKTGKTAFLLQTILNQSRRGTVCVYAAIGKKKTDIRRVEQFFERSGISDKTIIVASSATDSAGIVYVTPYSAMTIAEYFRDCGKDVLIILDDLSIHAKFYREISLLGKNFPGRSSYPSDIFYTHSRLVERAGNFKTQNGEASITCLPVAETVEGDISGYIQTNLMSMTDGHIFFDKDLFAEGRRPAVNFSLSVTRVGRQTQTKVRSGINRELNNFLSLFEKTQSFVHFGAELSEGVKTTLSMGNKILDFFNQPADKIFDINLQIMLYCLIWVGIWNENTVEETREKLEEIIKAYEDNESVRQVFDEYVSSASDFNELLGRLSSESKQLLGKIGVGGKKK